MRVKVAESTVLVLSRMSLGTSEALRELLSACLWADQVAALHTLGLHPGLINEQWAGEEFHVAGGGVVYQGDTAIIAASKGGNEALVLELVKRGAEVNARDGEGFDALMYASEYGHTAVVAVLLNHGADPNTRSQHCTALDLAAAWDHLPVCLLLVARAADLYAVNAVYGQNALEAYGRNRWYLTPAVLEERREALRVAFAEGPHASQILRRRDEHWARRWPFMLMLVGHGFRPLEARRQEMALAIELLRLVVSEPSGGEPADAPLTRRDECVRIVFRADNLVRLIASLL